MYFHFLDDAFECNAELPDCQIVVLIVQVEVLGMGEAGMTETFCDIVGFERHVLDSCVTRMAGPALRIVFFLEMGDDTVNCLAGSRGEYLIIDGTGFKHFCPPAEPGHLNTITSRTVSLPDAFRVT